MNHKRILLAAITFILIAGNLLIDRWDKTLYQGDSCFYYMHVVSAFVHQDVGDYDKTITTLREVNPSSADPREDIYGVRLTEKGRRYIKYTLGVPVLETPFFFVGHLYATLSPKYESNGWTRPYTLSVGFAIVTYVIIAFYLLIGLLKRYFSNRVVTLACLSLVLATNLFYHTNYVTMSHGFLFFLHVWLLHATIKFWDKPGAWWSLLLGAIVGLIALTRVPEIVVALVPVVWGIHNGRTALDRLNFIFKNFLLAVPAIIGFGVVFSLQISYWYYVSGHLIFNPYQGEGFDFLHPRIYEAFFYYDNGWLIYTPIMVFALAGLFLLRRYGKGWVIPILSFVVLQCWIHYSYYVYNYFPGLGQRPMVETYPYLVFPLAACFAALLSKNYLKWIPLTALVACGSLNLFQTWQSKEGYIWTERHNKAFYLTSFGKLCNSINGLRSYHTGFLQPEEHEIKLLDTLMTDGFESVDAYGEDIGEGQARSGRMAFHSTREFQTLEESYVLPASAANGYLKVAIHGYLSGKPAYPGHDQLAALVTEILDENGKIQDYHRAPISVFIGNEDGNIWTTGEHGIWGEASYYVPLPETLPEAWSAKIYLHNWAKQDIWLDDFSVSLYQRK